MNAFILGFNQEILIQNNLTAEDAIILRSMIEIIDGSISNLYKGYTWIKLDDLLGRIPIVGKRRFVQMRIAYYVKIGLIQKIVIHALNGKKGTFHMIKLLPKLNSLEEQVNHENTNRRE